MRRSGISVSAAAIGILLSALPAAPADADDTYWQHDPTAPGDWLVGSNWTWGVPGSADTAYIENGGTAVIGAGGTAYKLYLGNASGSEGTCRLSGGALSITTATSGPVIGNYGTGTFVQTGGDFDVSYYLMVGYNATGVGTFDISDGTVTAGGFVIGRGASGLVRQTGGNISVTECPTIDSYTIIEGNGRYEVSDGSLLTEMLSLSGGEIVQTGGTFTAKSTSDTATSFWLYSGDVAVSDGTFSAGGMRLGVGETTTCKFSQTGGIVETGSHLVVSGWAGSSEDEKVYHLSGGSLVAGAVTIGAFSRGEFRVTGATAIAELGSYTQRGAGILATEIAQDGITTIHVLGAAELAGDFHVADIGAEFARFDVLAADGGISGTFGSVVLPGPDWSWGIEGGTTLWVEHVPEPATMALLAVGGLCLVRKRR